MRCKNCKSKIENENLFRCPHCGKPLTKKEKKEPKELVRLIAFIAVSGLYIIMNFFSLFFQCDYYNTAALIIGIVMYMVAIPFVFGDWVSKTAGNIFALAVSVPYIASWCASFVPNSYTLAVDGYTSAYYFSVIGVIAVVDIIVILNMVGKDGKKSAAKWICLALGFVEAVFSIVFYAPTAQIKALAIIIIAVNCFMPAYIAYYVISKNDRKALSLA